MNAPPDTKREATHFGDPCIHCETPHDEVPVGACVGDRNKAIVLAYCISRQAWQNYASGCDTILCHMSDGSLRTETYHPSEWWWNNVVFKDAKVLAPHEFRKQHGWIL